MKLKIQDLFIILFTFIYLISAILIFSTNSSTHLLNIEISLLLLGLILEYKNHKHIIPNFTCMVFLVSFMVRLFVVVTIDTMPVSDFRVLYDAAQQAAHGKFEFSNESYFITWAYQTGFVLFEALFLKIFNNIWMLKFVNCLLGAGITVLIYKIVLLLWNDEKAARLISVIYAVFPFHVVHITVLTNSHVSAFFIYLGLYLLLKHIEDNKIKWFVVTAICLATGNIMRPEGIIFITSIVVFYLFKLCINFSKGQAIKLFKQLSVILLVYLAVLSIADASIKLSGINSNGLKNNDPLWKFVLGTNYAGGGTYSDTDWALISEKQQEYGLDREKAELYIIKERLASKTELFDLMLKKIECFWWSDSAFNWSFTSDSWTKIKQTLKTINTSLFWVILMLSMFIIAKLKNIVYENTEAIIFPIIIFVTFIVYLLIEVQPRYAYLVQIAVFIGGGIWNKVYKRQNKNLVLLF